ncbi:hypothetical protein GQX73_g4105 [Xylaria multiplex]|uniref:Fe2OG dioxygenase domain-containing protein n=1 Tax=Xylaria multiplex TaxID=323545 RepID=A0A7C8IRL3_9PEZI|nr:hypothetical protein GQX73_g4105 [Xylaria multiplex]
MFRWPPTVDAGPIFPASKSGSISSARLSFATELVSILKAYGFARVRNHGVAPVITKRLFKFHRQFFDLPLSTKLTVQHPGGESPARGYSPWAYEKTAVIRPDLHATSSRQKPTQMLLDAREQFAMGPPSDTKFETPRLGEGSLPGFDTAMSDSYRQIAKTCSELVNAIEEGLGAPPGCISGPTAGGKGAELNLNFYPEVERSVLEDELDALKMEGGHVKDDQKAATMRRIWPHSDLGVVSVLFQDSIGETGLEVQLRGPQQNKFMPVSVEDDNDLVLLVSNTLERWTNGQLQAAVHRVGLPPAISRLEYTSEFERILVPERRSAVMFFRASPTVDLHPLPYFISPENPAKYEHITAEEYLRGYNRRLY